MSHQALDEFEKARNEILLKQRECAWCGFKATSAKELAEHILKEHLRTDR